MELPDLIPLIPTMMLALVAFYGAVLSTINFLKEREREKPQIGVVTYSDVDMVHGQIAGFHSYIVARNNGSKSVTLDHAFIQEYVEPQRPWIKLFAKNNEKKWPKRTETRYIRENNELSGGKCYEVEMFDEELDFVFGGSPEKKLIAVFVDQLGNQYKSKPCERQKLFS